MRVVSLGHAGLRLESTTTSLLVDPWLEPEGAFLGSWFPFPDNAHLVPVLRDASAVVITHEHRDHFDPWVLRRLPTTVPVYIPAYPSSRLANEVSRLGHRVIEVASCAPMNIGSIAVHFVAESSPMNHDCAVGFRGDGTAVLNMNDARLNPLQLRMMRDLLGGRVDLLLVQCAGASWYPIRYSYPPRVMAALVAKKRAARLAYAASVARVVEAGEVVPFAGPPCFLDAPLAGYNEQLLGGVFPQPAEAAEYLAAAGIERVALLEPGDASERGNAQNRRGARASLCAAELHAYIDAYRTRRRHEIVRAAERAPDPAGDLDAAVHEYFGRLVNLSPYFRSRIGMPVGLNISGPHGGTWTVNFMNPSRPVTREPAPCNYSMRFESRWLQLILRGELFWEDLLLSLRIALHRQPDHYNDHLLGLLKFADARALAAVERYETSTVVSDQMPLAMPDGRRVEVERRCPHAGNDLAEFAQVDLHANTIRCLAHNYEFDLNTGECLNATCGRLGVRDAIGSSV